MEEKQLKIFSERLTKLREEKGLTQKQLCETLQIQRVTITKYETAERAPTLKHLVQFAQFFKVPTDYLLGLSDVPSYDIELQAICDYTGLNDNAIHALKYYNKVHQKNYDDLYFEVQNYFIEKEYLNLFCEALFSLRFHSGICNCLIEHFTNENEEKNNLYENTMDTIQKCDLYRYRLIKLSEELANHFDVRNECLKLALSREDFAKMEAAENGKHNPPKE